MVIRKSTLIDEYNILIRKIVNDRAQSIQVDEKGTFLAKAKQRLRYDNEERWNFLCSTMDLIDDTILAIKNFEEFKLEGPTKYGETGEKYLRLYGFLSSVYLLQSSIIQLCTIFKLDNKNSKMKKLQEHPLIQTRHKLASHALNYREYKEGLKHSFVLHRGMLKGSSVEFLNNNTDKFESIDLIEELDSYLNLVLNIQKELIEKLISTLFSTSKEKREKYQKELANLKYFVIETF